MTDDEIEALREQTDHGDRLDEETDHGDHLDEATDQDDDALRESIAEYLAAIEAGEKQKTVSVWDGDLAALVAALEDNPDEMQAVGEALREEFDDTPGDDPDRSEVLRRAVRLGLREAAPEHVEALRDAVRDHAIRDI